jgi:very-short-patch-repair endonuclease
MHARVWRLVRRQHGVIARRQLLALGYSDHAIDHRVAKGRLHLIHRGVYAVGRRELTQLGRFMAAVLSCGDDAVLSHDSAAALWGIRPHRPGPIHVSVPASASPRRPGIRVHRRAMLDVMRRHGIPVTSPASTLVDIAVRIDRAELERAVNEAANEDLIDPEALRAATEDMRGHAGVRVLQKLLDIHTYEVTDSRLEQRFPRIVRGSGVAMPKTQRHLEGGRVDFFWPGRELIVEVDSLRYHRTPAQQAADRLRDQKQAAAGLTPLRFTHAQVFFDPAHVRTILREVARRLAA